jgi:hypothetical protein
VHGTSTVLVIAGVFTEQLESGQRSRRGCGSAGASRSQHRLLPELHATGRQSAGKRCHQLSRQSPGSASQTAAYRNRSKAVKILVFLIKVHGTLTVSDFASLRLCVRPTVLATPRHGRDVNWQAERKYPDFPILAPFHHPRASLLPSHRTLPPATPPNFRIRGPNRCVPLCIKSSKNTGIYH